MSVVAELSRGVAAPLSKKVIVFPTTAEDRVAVSFTAEPAVIPPDGMVEPSA